MHPTADHILNEHQLRRRTMDLLELLEAFRRDYATVVGDDILRFELLSDHMFTTFTSVDNSSDTAIPTNLDTGDPMPAPFSPLLAGLQAETRDAIPDIHHYYRPGSIDGLRSACLTFLDREGFRGPRSLSNLEVLPGAGTTQLYDSLCKVHVECPGDTVLVPELGYGWFLTQPGRVGGRVAAVSCDERGAMTASSLRAAIDHVNQRLWEDWRQDSETLYRRAIRRLAAEGFVEFCPDHEGVAKLQGLLESGPDGWRSVEAEQLLADISPGFAARGFTARALRFLRPPRVVALLHPQPTVTGHIYSEIEVARLASVLTATHVVAFEDFAYHSIRCRLRDLASLQATPAVTYTLLGVSKPMAAANLRLGVLLVDRDYAARANRSIESATSYVSAILQRALATAFRNDGFDRHVTATSWGYGGYETREQLMYRMLSGVCSEQDGPVLTLLRGAATRESFLEPFVNDFFDHGLMRWFQPLSRPRAGFFHVVSCAPLLEIPAFRRLGIRSSFDVFAMLAYLFDLRSIPEECMGLGRVPGHRLRFAFSQEPELVARLFLRAFAGLTALERQPVRI